MKRPASASGWLKLVLPWMLFAALLLLPATGPSDATSLRDNGCGGAGGRSGGGAHGGDMAQDALRAATHTTVAPSVGWLSYGGRDSQPWLTTVSAR